VQGLALLGYAVGWARQGLELALVGFPGSPGNAVGCMGSPNSAVGWMTQAKG
jgi:hypothetical protein